MAPLIGIVGGIGSGKSAVAAELVAQGGYLIPADELGHEALRRPEIKALVAARWGERVLDADGAIDRKRLAAIVFADPAERRALEAMTHPTIGRRIREEIANARARPEVRLIVLDAAVMLEAGWHDVCDHVVFVDAPRDIRLQRLETRRGWSAQALEERENAQMPLPEKRRHADAVVDNVAGPEALGPQVRRLLEGWGHLNS
jgi:dephospho-CoA kinase